jgi:hypothetical protein
VLLSHSRLDRPVAFPGIRGQGKAVGSETPPTALLFWCGFCLKSQMTARRFPPPAIYSLLSYSTLITHAAESLEGISII